MLWFRNEADLFKCISEFNTGCREPGNKIKGQFGVNFFKFGKGKVSGVVRPVCVGFNEVNILKNQEFVKFMNRPENRDSLEANTVYHPENTTKG